MVTYRDAGVDTEKWGKVAAGIKGLVKGTFNSSVLTGFGSFGGAFSAEALSGLKEPVLVSTIDGVGTKMKVAAMMKRFDTVGIDIVNHCSNDILCMGAKPLFFLDYIAGESLSEEVVPEIVKGLTEACRELKCPLVSGETAEMPGTYAEGEYDLAGTMVGVAEKGEIISGKGIREGDLLIVLPSDGLHTNGYSLARKVLFEVAGFSVNDTPEGFSETLGEALLRPHKSYSAAVLQLKSRAAIKGIAHITGGGIEGNLSRVLPEGTGAVIDSAKLETPLIFSLIQEKGKVAKEEMFRTFNMGAGLILVVSEKDTETVVKELKAAGQPAYIAGRVVKGKTIDIA
jgi:phosphoribosylformylglycinamidine cyclo-ligase